MSENMKTSVVSRFDSTDALVHVSQMCSHPDLLNNDTFVWAGDGFVSDHAVTFPYPVHKNNTQTDFVTSLIYEMSKISLSGGSLPTTGVLYPGLGEEKAKMVT